MHNAVLAGPPTGAGMVTLKDNGRLLTAEFRKKTSALNMMEKKIRFPVTRVSWYHSVHITLP